MTSILEGAMQSLGQEGDGKVDMPDIASVSRGIFSAFNKR